MNENISFIKKLKISITSIKGYKELIKQKLSQAIIYSILLSLIVGSIQGIISFTYISSMQRTIEKVISSSEFKFTLQDGILNFENSPIKSEEGRSMVYINTNISLDDLESIRSIVVHKDISFSILKDGLSCRINGEEYNYKFSDIPLVGTIDNEIILKSLSIIGVFKYIFFISTIIVTYITFMINTFILSILGIILSKINNLNLQYANIFKISIYATTLPTVLSLAIPISSFSFLISGAYLMLVVNNLRYDNKL
ncbi:DUF1189 family protein [Clostridium sp. AL.422]|uniref:DUF1189 family protein n=1 Tax=Clostridium TaxID=1485 RepID=UPI00293DA4CA|nr:MULTISPECIES: DUF1189 family protein [unclassified Clostridium]MDV4151682.1 DUF1189 family protein [Clostridium sp. AL.422]